MSKNKRKQSAKKKQMGAILSLPPLRPSCSTSSSWRLYQDCRLELDRFLDVLYYQEFDRLIIEGSPPIETLKDAWRKVYLQYCELTQEGSYNELFDKTKQHQELNARITLLDGIIQYLQLSYDPGLVKIVNEMGISLLLQTDEDPVPKLKAVQGRMKRMILDLRRLEGEIEQLEQTHRDETKIDYFDDWLSIMSRSYGYAVRAKDISVVQFVRNQRKLHEQSQKQENK